MTGVIVTESHISGRFDASQQALAAARSGITWGTYYLQNGGTAPLAEKTFILNDSGSSYKVTIDDSKTITSIGMVESVQRKLVYKYKTSSYVSVPNEQIVDAVNTTVNATDSFSYNYSAWIKGTTSTSFGIQDPDDKNEIFVKIDPSTDDGTATLTVKAAGEAAISKSVTNLTTKSTDLSTGYDLDLSVTYYRGVGVELTVASKDPANSNIMTCHRRIAVALPKDILTFTNAKFVGKNDSGNIAMVVDTAEVTGDGNVVKIRTDDANMMFIDSFGRRGFAVDGLAVVPFTVTPSLDADNGILTLTASGSGSSSYLVQTSEDGSTSWVTVAGGSGTITSGQTIDISIPAYFTNTTFNFEDKNYPYLRVTNIPVPYTHDHWCTEADFNSDGNHYELSDWSFCPFGAY